MYRSAPASRRRASAPLRRKLTFFLYNEFESQYNSNWVRELRNTHAINIAHLLEFVQLWGLVQGAVRHNDRVTGWIQLLGNSLHPANTRLNRLTKHNSLGQMLRLPFQTSGGRGHRRNANYSHGLYFKIGSGPLTDWPDEDGRTTPLAPYIGRHWRLPYNCLLTVASQG